MQVPKKVWCYQFALPGATRQKRNRIFDDGFATKKEAVDAETKRRIEEQQKRDLAKRGASVTTSFPTTLSTLQEEFFAQHVDEKLAPKTIERYHQQAAYIHKELLAMPILEITSLHLTREWTRLSKCGGHTRQNTPRPMSPKTVRNIAGVVSSAFVWAIRGGLISANPVTHSALPRVKKHYGIALTSAQQEMVIQTASGPWCMPIFLPGSVRCERRAPRRSSSATMAGHSGRSGHFRPVTDAD